VQQQASGRLQTLYLRGEIVSRAHTIVRVRVCFVCQVIHTLVTTICNRRDSGLRLPGDMPLSFDKNILRPHDFPLASEDTDVDPVNHPAVVNTSDQPSFSSVYFSPLPSAKGLRASDISPMPSLNLQPNTRGGTAKKITNSPYKKFVGTTYKKNIKQATESKTNRLASNAVLRFEH